MRQILSATLMFIFLQPVSAQRKYINSTNSASNIETVMVQGGSFDMGSDNEAADRKPAHTVTLPDFYISTYEITQAQWKAIMGNNPSFHLCDDCPVNNVSYADVQAFIEKLNSQTGKQYRLPTEAEWEYAARGGAKQVLVKSRGQGEVGKLFVKDEERVPEKFLEGKKYSGKRLPQDVAWFSRNSNDRVHPVGLKKPNELGIYDMSGNVEEWCADWYAPNYGSSRQVENPKGPASGRSHVVRGGSYSSNRPELVVTYRAAYLPATKASSLGFRLAMDK